jgi:Carboxypeptidase regulatory-like domain/TonB dependent receptor-like, beta-barrel/TonB-dependent Receptor Plug Domain
MQFKLQRLPGGLDGVSMKTAIVFALVLSSGVASAQTATGVIDGVLKDPDGGTLPGVQVVANSPSLITRDLTVFSDSAGYYRLQSLPPGTYTVTFTLAGFQTVERVGLIVNSGQTTNINILMAVAGVAESVTVIGGSPTVDPSSAKLGFTYSQSLIENIPTRRDFNALAATIPGVESATNFGTNQPGANEFQNVLGAGPRANFYMFDGTTATDPSVGANQSKLFSYDIIEEVQVLKGGKPAEVGFAQGGYFQIITKSGGNQFDGVGSVYWQDESLQSNNVDDRLRSYGVTTSNRLLADLDTSATAGGPIVQNRLWWLGSARRQRQELQLLGFSEDLEDLVHAYFWKNTAQLARNHRLTGGFNHWDEKVNYFFFGFPPSLAAGPEVSKIRDTGGTAVSTRWNGVLTERLIADAAFGYSSLRINQLFQDGAGVPIRDLITGMRYQNPGGFQRISPAKNWDYNTSMSWFVSDALGRHDLKTGVQIVNSPINSDYDEIDDHLLLLSNGAPSRVNVFNTPVSVGARLGYASAYLQDSWTIGGAVTLNLGVRYDHIEANNDDSPVGGGAFANTSLEARYPVLHQQVVPGGHLLTWNDVAPRLAVSWSINPETAVRGSLSRYYHYLQAQQIPAANLAAIVTLNLQWTDLNNDARYQVGEEGRLLSQSGGTTTTVDPEIDHPYSNEAIIGISRELGQDFSLNASFVYRLDRQLTNLVNIGVPFSAYNPVVINDPGEDGVTSTADDRPLTVFARQQEFLGRDSTVLSNPLGNERTYKGLEIVANKRFSKRYQFVGSVVWSDMDVIQTTNDTGQTSQFNDPNTLLNARGKDPLTQTLQVKLQGTYAAPYGIMLSGFYRYGSGLPFTRTLSVSGLPQGIISVFAEPRGSRLTDRDNLVDLRVEKSLSLHAGMKLGLMLDVFNLTNASTVTEMGSATGVDLGVPRQVRNPRIARLGARFTW